MTPRSLADDLLNDPEIKRLVQADQGFAVKLYAALCNIRWLYRETNAEYTCSWRYAGGIVAKIEDAGNDYLSYYCSGGEGSVAPEIEEELKRLGWQWALYEDVRS